MNLSKGLLAGFLATVALSALMLVKSALGILPEMNAIKMLASMAHQRLGLPASPLVGWVAHFLIGTVAWGLAFAAVGKTMPGGNWPVKGIVFSAIAWLAMMIVVMPMAGAGLFGLNIGPMAPVATLLLHFAFGAVLGLVYRPAAAQPTGAV